MCKHRWTSLWDYYRKYLKKVSAKSGQSEIKIPKWKYADEMSFVRQYLHGRDAVTNLQFDEKGKMDEEELLQAEKEHDSTAEKEEQTPAIAKNKVKYQISWGTQQRPRHQPETASAVLMKYLVDSETKDKQNHQESKFTHSSEYSSGYPDEPGMKGNRVCNSNSAPESASEFVEMNSST